ncbi:MAG: amidase [Nocardioides sp.]
MNDDIFFAGVTGQAAAVRDGDISSRELVSATLERIQRYDGRLNAFTNVLHDAALAEAAERDAAPADARGPLHGVPVAIKEEIDVAGAVTTFGGRANVTPAAADGEVVRRLRAAGAVIVGKTNMPEFGQWPFTESVAHGISRNPWDTNRSTGGSSGGTAAAVAAGLVPAAMGGDGGGSIRIPSACCGLFGLKPQRGRVTSAPMGDLWWALGTVGPLTRSVIDSAVMYDVVRGSVPGDRFRAAEPRTSFVEAAGSEPGRLRIGWSTKPVTLGVKPDPEHVQAVVDVAAILEGLGHHVEEVDPHYPDPTAAFVPQFFAGVRSEVELVERPELLERRTRETARLGSWVRPGVVEWAMRQGEKVAAKANQVFERYDVLLTPTIAHRPPEVGVLDGVGTVRAALKSMPMIAYCALWNVTGNPAASVPVGFGRDGLPTGVQLVGRPDDEVTLLALSAQLEQAQPWADRRPEL